MCLFLIWEGTAIGYFGCTGFVGKGYRVSRCGCFLKYSISSTFEFMGVYLFFNR